MSATILTSQPAASVRWCTQSLGPDGRTTGSLIASSIVCPLQHCDHVRAGNLASHSVLSSRQACWPNTDQHACLLQHTGRLHFQTYTFADPIRRAKVCTEQYSWTVHFVHTFAKRWKDFLEESFAQRKLPSKSKVSTQWNGSAKSQVQKYV